LGDAAEAIQNPAAERIRVLEVAERERVRKCEKRELGFIYEKKGVRVLGLRFRHTNSTCE